jgi:hypothetical protein
LKEAARGVSAGVHPAAGALGELALFFLERVLAFEIFLGNMVSFSHSARKHV